MTNPLKWKLAVELWIAGMAGVLAMVVFVLPALLAQRPRRAPLPLPLWAACVISFAQAGLILALFVWAGGQLAPRIGLRAPVFEALAAGRSGMKSLSPQLVPGLLGGLAVAIVPWYFIAHNLIIPIHRPRELLAAVLYGGITEEIFMRWGLMTFLGWALWHNFQRAEGPPSAGVIGSAIFLSAVIFGAGHLPATRILLGGLPFPAVASVIAGGTFFGIIAGYLYRRYGLECAMICHATSHLLAYAAYKVLPR